MRKPRSTAALILSAAIVAGAVTIAAASPTAQPPLTRSAPAADHVFLIIGENTSASQITPVHAPFLTGALRPQAAWITTYHSFKKSSSLGNYIAMTSGQFIKCEANNDLPDKCHQNVENIFHQVQATGRTWFEYSEGAANACDIVDHGAAWSKNIYSAHHNPALYYLDVHGKGYDEAITPSAACREHNLPAGTTAPNDTSTLDAALASGNVGALNVIIPNDCENGHDPCATKDPVHQFDDFLAREIPKIKASPAYGSTSVILITWDEGADPPLDAGNPLLLAIGAGVTPHATTTGSYDHYSLLRTTEDLLGLPAIAHARHARPLPLAG